MTKIDAPTPSASATPASNTNSIGPSTNVTANSTSTATTTTTGTRSVPRDTSVITSILKDLDIHDYEPRLVHQLLEFTYRYVTSVLEDAQIFSQYANKKTIDVQDVKLAIQLQVERMFTSPPPRDLLMEIARQKNNQPLPAIKSPAGLRLPPDRYSLISCNYRLKSTTKLKAQQLQQQNQAQQQIIHLSPQTFTLPLRSLQTGGTILANLPPRPIIGLKTQTPTSLSNPISIVNINNNTSNTLRDKTTTDVDMASDSPGMEDTSESGVKRKLEESDVADD